MSLRGGAAAAAGIRGSRRPAGPPLDADRSDALSLARSDARAGRALRRPGARTSSSSSPRPRSGSRSMEEATYRGVSVNATVSFSVAQAVAAAEAVERGLRRREAEGLPIDRDGAGHHADDGPHRGLAAGPDRARRDRRGPGGPAVVRASRSSSGPTRSSGRAGSGRGCSAQRSATTCTGRSSIGGDVVITMPAVWQRRFNASAVEVRPRMDDPVAPADRRRAPARFPDFVRAFEPDGLSTRGVRHLRPDRADAARVHRLVPRAAPPGGRRAGPEPGRPRLT